MEMNNNNKQSTNTLSDFNSTTILAEKVENGKDVHYNPFEHRDMSNANTTMGSLAHLMKGSLGSGILAMPMAFKNAGILFGAIGTIVVGLICTHCYQIFVKTSRGVCEKAKKPSLGFAETAETVFQNGPKSVRKFAGFARGLCDYGLCATHIGGNCVYIVFIATSFHDVINAELNVDWDVRYYIAVTVIPCIMLGEIRKLKYLVPFSIVANICIILTFIITLKYMFAGTIEIEKRPLFNGWEKLPLFFSTVIFAMEGIGVVMPIENSMKKPQHFLGCPGILSATMTVVVFLYASLGFFGYARYGDEIKGSITMNLPTGDPIAESAQILIGIAILCTFGLQYYVPMDILWRKMEPKIAMSKRNISEIVLRGGTIVVMGVIAAAVPKLDPFIGLVGSIFFSFLGLFIPALVETVFRWDDLGVGKWILIKNAFLMTFSLVALFSGSFVSMQEIIKLYKE